MAKEVLITESQVTGKIRKGIFLNHLAYRMAEVVDTYMMEAMNLFNAEGFHLRQEEKRKFNRMMDAARHFRLASKDFTKSMYECDFAETYLDTSDFFADFIKLTWDRVGEDADRQRRVRNAVRKFSSEMEFYKDPFYIETRKKKTKSKKDKKTAVQPINSENQ